MFDCYETAKTAVRTLGPLIKTVSTHDRDLARQMRRAGASVLLNIAEGWRRMGRDRRQLYLVAAGSNGELRAALDVSGCLGYLSTEQCKELEELLDRVAAMLYRLTR